MKPIIIAHSAEAAGGGLTSSFKGCSPTGSSKSEKPLFQRTTNGGGTLSEMARRQKSPKINVLQDG